jgi:hypothetical protein
MRLQNYLTEATKILYHGVTDIKNVDVILKSGFSLQFVKPRYKTDYAISAAKSYQSARNWMGKDSMILQFKYSGTITKTPPEIDTKKISAQEYTKKMLSMNIDAVDAGGAIFIYNIKKISNIEVY